MAVRFPFPVTLLWHRRSTHETGPTLATLTLPFLFLKLVLHLLDPWNVLVLATIVLDVSRPCEKNFLSRPPPPFSPFPSSPLSHESRGKISSLFILFSLLLSSFLLPDAHQPGFLTGSRRSWIGEQVRFPSPLLRSILTILNILLLRLFSFRCSLSLSTFVFPLFYLSSPPLFRSLARKGLIVPLTRCVYALSTLIMNAPVSFADCAPTRRRGRRLGSFNPITGFHRFFFFFFFFFPFLRPASFDGGSTRESCDWTSQRPVIVAWIFFSFFFPSLLFFFFFFDLWETFGNRIFVRVTYIYIREKVSTEQVDWIIILYFPVVVPFDGSMKRFWWNLEE